MSRRAITAALALCLALAGCGASGDEPTGTAGPSGSGSCLNWPDCESGPATSATTPALPAGYTWQTIEDASLTFAVPAQWSAINPKKLLAEGGDLSAFDDMAARMGLTSSQMKQAVGNADLMLLAPPKNGYADNVSGSIVPLEGLPTKAQLTGQLDSMSETDVVVAPGTSAVGDMMSATYTLRVGEALVSGQTLFFNSEDTVLNLAVSTLDPSTTAEVSEAIRTTIHKV